jgi:hypothetical protein
MQSLTSLGWPSYLILAGTVVCGLALVLYALPRFRMEIPAVLGSTLGALALGFGLGIVAMMAFGYHWERYAGFNVGVEIDPEGPASNPAAANASAQMMSTMMRPAGRSGLGSRASLGPKAWLATLIFKLDLLDPDVLSNNLSVAQKAALARQLGELEQAPELTTEEAKRRLDELLESLQPQRPALEAAGFTWPGRAEVNATSPAELANPFRDKENAHHLESVCGRLLPAKSTQ